MLDLLGDSDFAERLSDLRHRRGYHVILLHNAQARKALVQAASEAMSWPTFLAENMRRAVGEKKKKKKKAAAAPKPAAPAATKKPVAQKPAAPKQASSPKLKTAPKSKKEAAAPPLRGKGRGRGRGQPVANASPHSAKVVKPAAQKQVRVPTCKAGHPLVMGAYCPSGWSCAGVTHNNTLVDFLHTGCTAVRSDKSWHCNNCQSFDLCFGCHDKIKELLNARPGATQSLVRLLPSHFSLFYYSRKFF